MRRKAETKGWNIASKSAEHEIKSRDYTRQMTMLWLAGTVIIQPILSKIKILDVPKSKFKPGAPVTQREWSLVKKDSGSRPCSSLSSFFTRPCLAGSRHRTHSLSEKVVVFNLDNFSTPLFSKLFAALHWNMMWSDTMFEARMLIVFISWW